MKPLAPLALSVALAGALPLAGQAYDTGYVRQGEPAQVVLITQERQALFRAYVASNLVPYAEARAAAVNSAGSYCIGTHGRNVVRIERVKRYSDLDLAAWLFQGRCK